MLEIILVVANNYQMLPMELYKMDLINFISVKYFIYLMQLAEVYIITLTNNCYI